MIGLTRKRENLYNIINERVDLIRYSENDEEFIKKKRRFC